MSSHAPINYKLHFSYANRPASVASQADFAPYDALRVSSWGSQHPGGAVFALADTLTVMVEGKVLASGPPAAIRANAQVQSAYLGEEAPHG
jgi:hypothetical protein